MFRTKIFLNSKDRDSGTNENFTYALDCPIKNITKVKLNTVTIPLTYYPINDNNDAIYWTDGAGVSHITNLTNQDYNATSLATELQTQLNADKDSSDTNIYSVSYDSQTFKYTVSLSSGTSNFSLLWTDSETTCEDVFGFSEDDTSSTSYTSDNVLSIGTDYIFLTSRTLSGFTGRSVLNGTQPRNTILKIPITGDIGSLQVYRTQDTENYLMEGYNNTICSLSFELLDDTYNTMDLNGGNWAIELEVFHS